VTGTDEFTCRNPHEPGKVVASALADEFTPTGHTSEQIDDLLAKITPLWREAYEERNAARRLRRTGSAHPRRIETRRGTLSLRDKLVLTLAQTQSGLPASDLAPSSGVSPWTAQAAIAEIRPLLLICGVHTDADNRPPLASCLRLPTGRTP